MSVCVGVWVHGLGDPQHSHLADSSMVGGGGGEREAFRQVNSTKLIMKGSWTWALACPPGGNLEGLLFAPQRFI